MIPVKMSAGINAASRGMVIPVHCRVCGTRIKVGKSLKGKTLEVCRKCMRK